MTSNVIGERAATGEVLLRVVRKADLPVFYEHQLDLEACRMADFSAREREPFMAHWERILTNDEIVTRTILCDGLVAGNIVSFVEEGQREIGYWLGREFWGKGVATRALTAFLALLTDRPLYAHAAKGNIASLHVLQKCGFSITAEDDNEIALTLGG